MSFVSQFKAQAGEKTRDLRHRQFIRTALRGYETARDKRKGAFQSWGRFRWQQQSLRETFLIGQRQTDDLGLLDGAGICRDDPAGRPARPVTARLRLRVEGRWI